MAGSGTASGGDSLADGSGEDAIIVRLRALSCALACSLGSLRGKEKKKRGFFGQRPRLRRRARERRKGVRSGANGDRGGLAIARARDPEVPHPLCHQRTRVLLVEKEKRKRAKRFSGLEARLGTPEARAWEERAPTCPSARDLSFDRARRRTLRRRRRRRRRPAIARLFVLRCFAEFCSPRGSFGESRWQSCGDRE